MPYSPRKLESILQTKFHFCPVATDHRRYELHLPGLPAIITKVSHSRKEIGRKLESLIARQLRVRTSYFRDMMDCTYNYDDYYRQVQEDPYPPFNVRF